ncbi:polymeric immunoglobulin receptor-like isoform X2 [Engraulis encrasicolus]|uniref:polymeric immunoglobulin receptor-like isoform X2 n=1 Tax=Engraulis encrasicolus TaxID=184585 RepID=UPI002FD1B810
MRTIFRAWILISLCGLTLGKRGGGRGSSGRKGGSKSSFSRISKHGNETIGQTGMRGGSSSSSKSSSWNAAKYGNGEIAIAPGNDAPSCRVEIKDFFGSITITGITGGSVLLLCNCEDMQSKPGRIVWSKRVGYSYDYEGIYNITEGDEGPYVHKDYRGRVALVEDGSPGNFSLVISDLREEDAATYRCYGDDSSDEVDLEVKGCNLARSGEREEISKFSGESVLLPCWCEDEVAKPTNFRWTDPNGRLIRSSSQQSGRYADRSEMFHEKAVWNVSLLLSDLTVEDEGDYTCEINGPENKVVYSLTVTGCALAGQDEVVEVEVPAGSSALLPCACTTLQAKPQNFRWTPPNNRELLWHYKGRAELFQQTSAPGNLSLLLTNLMPEDGGVYRCEIGEGKSKVFVLDVKVELEQP